MSYHIEYRRLNIQLSDGRIIPFSESWDNNCYQWAKRSRSFSSNPYFTKWKLADTSDNIRKNVEEFLQSQHKRQNENYPDDQKTYDDFLNMSSQYWLSHRLPWDKIKTFLTYFSTPDITIQEFLKYARNFEIIRYVDWNQEREYITSEEQLLEKFQEGDYLFVPEASLFMYYYEKKIANRNKRIENNREKVQKEFTKWWQVSFSNSEDWYTLWNITSKRWGSFRYRQSDTGKIFIDKKKAQKFCDELQKARPSYKFSVDEYNTSIIQYV